MTEHGFWSGLNFKICNFYLYREQKSDVCSPKDRKKIKKAVEKALCGLRNKIHYHVNF